jgi:hypothetical protein
MKPLIAIVLVVFGAFNCYVAAKEGYWSVFPPFDSLSKTQMFVDLAVSLGLFNVWMYFDWRRTQRPMYQLIPFLLAPVFVGSIGPLLYLLFRESKR